MDMFMLYLWIVSTCCTGVILAQNTTVAASDNMSDLSKAFISAGVLSGAIIISVIIAKIVDHFYDRASIRDDASDISEHTRNLIRARLAVRNFKMPKKEIENIDTDKKSKHKKLLRLWSAKARARSGSYPRTPKLSEINKEKSKDFIIKIEEMDETEKPEIKEKEKSSPKVTFVTENEDSLVTDISKQLTPDNSVKLEKPKNESMEEKPSETISSTPKNDELPGTPLSNKQDDDSVRTGSPDKTSPSKTLSPSSRPKTAPSGGVTKGNNANKPPVSRSFLSQKSVPIPGTAKRVNTASPGGQPVGQTRGKTGSSTARPPINSVSPVSIHAGKSTSSSGRHSAASVSPVGNKSGSVTARPALGSVSKTGKTNPKSGSSNTQPANNVSKTGAASGNTARNAVGSVAPMKNNQAGRVSPTKSIYSDKLQTSTQSMASSNPSTRNLSSILMSMTGEPDKEEFHSKKLVQFRGDSDDLLELVKNEGKTKAEKMSFEKEQGTTSSSPEYEFLAKNEKTSPDLKSKDAKNTNIIEKTK